MRRAAVVLTTAALVVAGLALPAAAQDRSLDDWIRRANAAAYSGSHVTVCETPDGERAELVDLAQRDGVVVVGAGDRQAVVTAGALYDLASDGTVRAASVDVSSSWALGERYHASAAEDGVIIGRTVDVVQVLEGSLVRMELSFDRVTGAVLRSVTYNADGSIYCTAAFVSFSEQSRVGTKPATQPTTVLVHVEPGGRLPDTLAGFDRREAFEGPGGSTAGFYSDGIFSFTLLVADRAVRIGGLADAGTVTIDGKDYQRVFLAGQALYSWSARDGGYVMLGNQPLDLQEAVLADLPEPGSPGIITRFWRRLFG